MGDDLTVYFDKWVDGWHITVSRYYARHLRTNDCPDAQRSHWEASTLDRTVIYIQDGALFVYGGKIPLTVIDELRRLEPSEEERAALHAKLDAIDEKYKK